MPHQLTMEEYCETHQLVRKRREIFENIARQNAEASKIQIKRTNRPWSRNLSKSTIALNVLPTVGAKNVSDDNNVRRISGGSGVSNATRYIRSTTIHTTSDSVSKNSIDRNRISNYGNNSKSVVSVFSGSERKSYPSFNQSAMEAEKEEEPEKIDEIWDKISASYDLPAINHNKNTQNIEIAESSESDHSSDDEFGENEEPHVELAPLETRNLVKSEREDTFYEKYFEKDVTAEIAEIPKLLDEYDETIEHTEAQSEGWSEDEDFSDSFDSGTEEEGQDYEVVPLPPPVQLNIGKIRNVLEEMVSTEEDYVKKLEHGIENYVKFMINNEKLPLELKGKKNQIFGVIEKIYEFHRNKFHPALLKCNYDLDEIIEKFRSFIQQDYFYSYVLYAMNKPKSEAIVRQNQSFFQDRQNSIDDKLGLPSFLMQPIQRLPKYRLLVSEMIKEFMKNIDKIENNAKLKNTLGNLCLTEKELQKVLDAANESISVNDIQFDDVFINIHHQGKFVRCGEFDIHDHSKTKNKYRGKIFLFSKALIYTEYLATDKQQLIYRGSYDRMKMGLRHDQTEAYYENKKKFFIFDTKMGQNELEFNRTDDNHDNWYAILQQILYEVMEEERKRIKLNQFRVSKSQINESVRTSLVKFNQPPDRSSSTSSGSITSGYISNRSSRCSADSYEIGNSTWEERKNSEKVRNSEKYYLTYLRANRKAYIEQITDDDQKQRILQFQKEIDRIYNFHRNFLLPKILECGANYEDIIRLFQKVYDAGKFHLYIKYSMVTNIGCDILTDLFPLGSNPTNNSNVLAIDEYVKLPVYRINYYLSLLESYMTEIRLNNNWNTDIFKTVAILQTNLLKIHKKVEETHKLFAIRQNTVRLSLYGSCEYSDLVSIDKFGTLNHRICIMEDGLILIKIKTNAETQEEFYKEIVFNVPYSLGLSMRGSKKNTKKISFETVTQKSVAPGITFRTLEKREVFKNTLLNIRKM